MSDFQCCPTCKRYDWLSRHRCAPAWECRLEWHKDDDGAWCVTHAIDAEQAAERFAEHYDCEGGEYAIVGGRYRDDVIVQVRKRDEETFEQFVIEAEAVPTYRASKHTPQDRTSEASHD
jgi:hypothetical protein